MKEKTKKMVVGGFFAFLMVASVVGFAVNFVAAPTNSLDYYDHRFTITPQNTFKLDLDGQTREFLFFPGDIESVTLPESTKELFEKAVVTVTYDPESELKETLAEAQYYFETQLDEKLVIERALTNSTGTALSEKSCESATEEQPIIMLNPTNESGITLENNCLKINAIDNYDLIQQTERVIYTILGVME